MIKTERLLLRPFRESDKEPFAKMNADPIVREFFPNLLTKEESDAFVERIWQHREEHGFTWYAVEIPGEAEFIGGLGLWVPNFEAHFMPCVEIGWRLAAEFHGKGYCTEGAQAVLEHAFSVLKLKEVVSFTAIPNKKSSRVMEKIGMHFVEEFDHPKVPDGNWLKRHVLYKRGAGSGDEGPRR